MTKGWMSFLALCLASIAVLYQVELDKDRWIASQSITLKAKLSDAFRFVTTSDYMSKWFPFVTSVREVDGKDMGIGKKYRATYHLPVLGEYDMLYRVVEYIPHKMLAVESESCLRPRIEFHFDNVKEDECKMKVQVLFRRRSYLFQYTLGPLLQFLARQQLQRSLFLLRMVVSVLTQIQPAKLPEPPRFPGARLASTELAVLSTTNPLFQTTSGLDTNSKLSGFLLRGLSHTRRCARQPSAQSASLP
uniref:Putative secreted protein n=1 Tax=Ixodes ricinus TaxID=34613 RepID=A0A090XCW9_IXORI